MQHDPPGSDNTFGVGEEATPPIGTRDRLGEPDAGFHLHSTDTTPDALAFVVVRVDARRGSASSLPALWNRDPRGSTTNVRRYDSEGAVLSIRLEAVGTGVLTPCLVQLSSHHACSSSPVVHATLELGASAV